MDLTFILDNKSPATNEQFATSGAQLAPTSVRNSTFGSRPRLTDTPACGKLPPRYRQAGDRSSVENGIGS